MSNSNNHVPMNPLYGITDQASANKFVEEAMSEATPEQIEHIARIYLGDKYDEWKRLKDLANVKTSSANNPVQK